MMEKTKANDIRRRIVKTAVLSALTFASVLLLPVSVKAYTLTVINGTAEKYEGDAGDKIKIKAKYPEMGKCFRYWECGSLVFTGGSGMIKRSDAYETTVTMPAWNVEVEATYENIHITPLDGNEHAYTGDPIKPRYKIEKGGEDLLTVEDTDYTLSYKNNTNAGTATVNVTLIGKSIGKSQTEFTIVPVSISGAEVTVKDQVYNGGEQKPAVKVVLNGKQLGKDDYVLTYSDNVNAGTAHVIVTGRGNCLDTTSVEATFKITPADISKAKVSVEDQIYNGSELKPVPVVTVDGNRISEDNYVLLYSDNVEPGMAYVTVTGRNNFLETSSKKRNSKSSEISPRQR